MPTHVTALFADRHAAHAAIEQLVQAGFPRDAISLVLSPVTYDREFGVPTRPVDPDDSGIRSARPSGVLGAIVATLVAVAWPSGFAVRAAGPFAPVFVRTSEGFGAGELTASLSAAGLSGHTARFVDEGVRSGSIAVGVSSNEDRARLAAQLLELAGGAALQAA
jgi:hypothetical protein